MSGRWRWSGCALAALALAGCRCDGSPRGAERDAGVEVGGDGGVAPPARGFVSSYRPDDPGRDLVLSRSAVEAWTLTSTRQADVQRDLGVLWRALERGYAGWDRAPGGEAAWDGAFVAMSERVAGLGPSVPTPALLDVLAEELGRVAPRSGLVVEARYEVEQVTRRPGERGQVRVLMLDLRRAGERWVLDDAAAPAPELQGAQVVACGDADGGGAALQMWSAGTRRVVWRLVWEGDEAQVTCRLESSVVGVRTMAAPVQTLTLDASSAIEGVQRIADERAAVVRIAGFDWQVARGAERLREVVGEGGGGGALVIDVRGCSGGDEGLARAFGVALAGGEGAQVRTTRLTSEVTVQGEFNRAQEEVVAFERAGGGRPDEGRRQALEGRLGEAREALQGSVALGGPRYDWSVSGEVVAPLAGVASGGEVVIVVDRGCAGACEAFLQGARAGGRRVVLVGEASSGAGQGRAGLYRLPGSGVRVRVPTQLAESTRGPAGAAWGLSVAPDVWAEGDALEVALELVAARRVGEVQR